MQPGRAFLACCVLFPLYLLLAGGTGLHEIIAGVGCLCVLLVLVLASHRSEQRGLRLHAPVRLVWRIVSCLVIDCGRVGLALCRSILVRPAGSAGQVVSVSFRHGDAQPDDAARRGIVTLAASLAPNGIVLALPQTRHAVLLHRLAPAPAPSDRDWPV